MRSLISVAAKPQNAGAFQTYTAHLAIHVVMHEAALYFLDIELRPNDLDLAYCASTDDFIQDSKLNGLSRLKA